MVLKKFIDNVKVGLRKYWLIIGIFFLIGLNNKNILTKEVSVETASIFQSFGFGGVIVGALMMIIAIVLILIPEPVTSAAGISLLFYLLFAGIGTSLLGLLIKQIGDWIANPVIIIGTLIGVFVLYKFK